MSGRPKRPPFAALSATWWKEYVTLSWVADAVFARLLSYCADCQQGGRFDAPVLYQIAAGRQIDPDAVLAELEAAKLIAKVRETSWRVTQWDKHNDYLAKMEARREADRTAKSTRREEAKRKTSEGDPGDVAPISDGQTQDTGRISVLGPKEDPQDNSGSGSDLIREDRAGRYEPESADWRAVARGVNAARLAAGQAVSFPGDLPNFADQRRIGDAWARIVAGADHHEIAVEEFCRRSYAAFMLRSPSKGFAIWITDPALDEPVARITAASPFDRAVEAATRALDAAIARGASAEERARLEQTERDAKRARRMGAQA